MKEVQVTEALLASASLLLLGAVACDRNPEVSNEPRPSSAAGGSELTPNEKRCADKVAAFELPSSPAPWTTEVDGHSCTHPAVEPNCKDGWCKIPAGCFVMGSPETEPQRGQSEIEVATTLTRAFVIGETEVTQGAWKEQIDKTPSGLTDTYKHRDGERTATSNVGDDYPVDNVSWLEAIYFANELSKSEGRPVCYEFVECTGTVGSKEEKEVFTCRDVALTTETLYECEGYRLPTEAEWEYAARAGTRTAYYSGGVPEESIADSLACPSCTPHLDAVGWHCGNSGIQTQEVRLKLANQWGLFDMLGDAMEWVHDEAVSAPGAAPWIDPNGPIRTGKTGVDTRKFKGGPMFSGPLGMRAAAYGENHWDRKYIAYGFRLARTIGEEETW